MRDNILGMKFVFFIFCITVLSSRVFADKIHSSMNAPKDQQTEFTESEFKPHMIDHFNEGCPTNSECSPELGLLFKSWSELAKSFSGKNYSPDRLENFRKRNGVPIPIWITEKGTVKDKLIIWDSPCRDHNLEKEEKIKIGMIFVDHLKKMESLVNDKKILMRFLRIYQGEDKPPKEIQSLRGETPLYFDGDKLIYQLSVEGAYYSLSLSQTGELKIVDTKTPEEYTQSMECPKVMEDDLKKREITKNLYSGFYCKRVWNIKSKKFEIIQVGWSCN